jgi:fructokinase
MILIRPRIGIDLGGTKIEAIVLDGNGDIHLRRRVDTPRDDYDQTLNAVVGLIAGIAREAGLDPALPVGIGAPGAVSLKTGRMKNCNSTCLNGQPLREDLESRLGRPVRIANDADCLTLSEASDGAGKGKRSVFGVILGTGVGGGICYHQRLLEGVNAICGEWGHTTLPLSGYQQGANNLPEPVPRLRRCFCGRFDCVETWLAGPALERTYREVTGAALPATAIDGDAASGKPMAAAVLDQYCNLLALALGGVINILDPDVIVLGGGVSNIESLYSRVPHYLPRYVFSDQVNTHILPAVHGDSSGVRGAAWLWQLAEVYPRADPVHGTRNPVR